MPTGLASARGSWQLRTATFSFEHVLLVLVTACQVLTLKRPRLGKGPQAVSACCGRSVGKTAPSDDDTPRVPSPPPVRTVRVDLPAGGAMVPLPSVLGTLRTRGFTSSSFLSNAVGDF